MTRWTGSRVAEVLGTAPPAAELTFERVSTDTRTLGPGDLFVALRGERFDGHAFLARARDAGARAAVVETGTAPVPGLVLFPVPDTLRALGALARARRREVTGPVVAVTGTNGKTATKELLARALATRWRVHATRANRNNEVGVPLTILEAPDDAEALVVEAGANTPGEIGRLRAVIEPDVGVITNVSAGHLEGFGTLDTVLHEKLALVDGASEAVVGTTPPDLEKRARRMASHVTVAGLEDSADVAPERWWLEDDGRASFVIRGHTVRLPLRGRHQAENAVLAWAVAERLALEGSAVAAALETVTLPAGRGEVLTAGDLIVLHDAYNANPASMRAALDTALAIRSGRPLVVLVGTMLELGAAAAEEHGRIAAAIVEAHPALIGATGAFIPAFEAYRAALGDRLITSGDPGELGRRIAARLDGHELVLLKASRGVRLEQALPHLLPDREAPCSTTS